MCREGVCEGGFLEQWLQWEHKEISKMNEKIIEQQEPPGCPSSRVFLLVSHFTGSRERGLWAYEMLRD